MDKIIIECECAQHLLQVQHDSEGGHETYYLALFNYGRGLPDWRRRLGFAWKMIRTGRIFADQVVLSPREAAKLANFIKEKSKPELTAEEKKQEREWVKAKIVEYRQIGVIKQ